MTLNQIVKQITTFGNNHPQINFVYFGDVWERLSNGEVTYPAMFFTLGDAQILQKQIQYNFSIYVMDRMLMEETNETDVLSDMTLIGQDIVAKLRSPEYNWITGENIQITFYTESDPDYLAGVKMDFTLTLSSLNDTCQIPQ
ncbi:hypothetical protein UFOVP19_6 [uncultured Caudovirales phage]|uniref:Uncharacterized protein n=1 Tax=uncultured Caudovirales phage TaxID=2100421 RepID=A0A6J5KJJ8_9CAUD|nr:hypothetical protein UFOVP19_6 [uncultured Caudovirales phage]